MDLSLSPPPTKHATALGVLCGAVSALFWAFGFVAARHGVLIGMSPLVLALHRFIWPGLALLPLVATRGFSNLGGLGWRRGIALTLCGGLPLALWSYFGYVYVPLGHGSIIQPSCAAVGGLILARVVIKEALPPRRIMGAVIIVLGLAVIGAEALRTMGSQGLFGDLLFVAAGCSFAIFGMLLRLWRLPPMRATAVTSVLSLVGLPILYSAAGVGAGRICGSCRHLPFHSCRGSARGRAGGGISVSCATVLAFDRLSDPGRGSEHPAACRARDRARRFPPDADQLIFRPGVFARRVREHRFHDLEA
jgi:drug/metabolite transporter (DMT)-like permease